MKAHMPHSKNAILARASPVDLEDLSRSLRIVDLSHGKVLAESRGRVHQVYFPHSGVISCVVQLEDGAAIESGMIGNDGAFGAGQALDDKVSLHKVVVQVPGQASVVDGDHIKTVALSSPPFFSMLMKYEQFLLGQIQQTTACNAVHRVEQRMCKWLVRMHDLAGSELPLTQEFLAQMMGVRRTSVTGVASHLQSQGMISYSRGKVRILNLELIQRRACECAHTVRELYATEFGSEGPASPPKPDTPARL
jgi:CRP-like cAMP-binding protein